MRLARLILKNPSAVMLAGFLLCILSFGQARAQGGVLQYGPIQTGHPAMWYGNGAIGDGGSPAGGLVGALGLTGVGVTNSGQQGVCANSGPITSSYAQLCLGFSSGGTPQITLGGYPNPTSLQFLINGQTYTIPSANGCSGCGTMAGQNSNNVSITGGSITNVTLSGLVSGIFNGATLNGSILSNTDLTMTTNGSTLTAQPLTSWLGAAQVPNKTVFIGSSIGGYANLANPANIPQILANPKIGLQQKVEGNAKVGQTVMAQIWSVFSGTGQNPTNGGGQSMAEVGSGSNQQVQYFNGVLPNELMIVENNPSNVPPYTDTYTATSSDKYPGTIYGNYYSSAQLQSFYPDFPLAHTYGAKNIAEYVYTPNGPGGAGGYDFDDPFATGGYWANLRAFALYSGAMVLDVPPSFALNQPTGVGTYIPMIEQMIQWGVQNNLRVTVVVSPYAITPNQTGDVGGCAYDYTFLESTENLFGQLKAANALPTSWVVENYGVPQTGDETCGTENDIETDTTPESINVVALYLARVAPTIPAGTAVGAWPGAVADAGLLTSATPVAAPIMSLATGHAGPLTLSDVPGYGSMATQESTDVQISGGVLKGNIYIQTNTTPLFLGGAFIQGDNGASYLNMNQTVPISAMSWANTAGGTVSVTTSGAYHLAVGATFKISGATPSAYNGTWTVATQGSPSCTSTYTCLTFLLPASTSPGAVTTLGQITGPGILTLGNGINLQISGSLDIDNGIYFEPGGNAPVIAGQTPIFLNGAIIQGGASGSAVYLTDNYANNTLTITQAGGGPANLELTGNITLDGSAPTFLGTTPGFSNGLLIQGNSTQVYLTDNYAANTLTITQPGGGAANLQLAGNITLTGSLPTFYGSTPFFNSGLLLGGGSGTVYLTDNHAANTLTISQTGGGAANLYLTGTISLGGELFSTNSTVASGSTAAAVPAGGWMKVNVNGTEYRVPLFSTTQAGG